MTAPLRTLLHTARRVAGPPADDPGDGELLDRFVTRQDEIAFAALLRRHGPWLLGLCRRLVADAHAAEDVFQATFLVLVRRAGAVRKRASVGSWLHGVALRVAARVRQRSPRWQDLDDTPAPSPAPDPADTVAAREAARLLHAEIARLPQRYREPILLCDLAGLSRDEAARRLGCGAGSVKGRLERGRAVLRDRLTRRGLAVVAGVAVVPAVVPAALAASLGRAAVAVAMGLGMEEMSPTVAGLVEGALSMSWSKKAVAAVALLGAAVAGVGLGAGHPPAGRPAKPAAPPVRVTAGVPPLVPAAPEPPPNNQPAKDALREAVAALDNGSGLATDRARLWIEVARLYGKLGDRAEAYSALKKARAIIDTMGQQMYWQWRALSQGYARLGDVKEALALADAIPENGVENFRGNREEFRQMIVQEAAEAAGEVGEHAAAHQLAGAIRDPEYRGWVEGHLRCRKVLARAKAGDVPEALREVESLPNATEKVVALMGTVYRGTICYGGHLDGEPGIVLFQIDAGDRDAARQSIRKALELTAAEKRDDFRDRAAAAVVRAWARLGEVEAASRELLRVRDDELRVKATAFIAEAHVRAGRTQAALDTIAALKSDKERAYALQLLAYAQAKAGDKDGARASFERAKKYDAASGNSYDEMIASSQAAAGQFSEAMESAERSSRETVWANIAGQQAKAGDFVGALRSVRKLGRAQSWAAMTLQFIATKQVQAGQAAAARVWIAGEENSLNRAYALFGLAEGLYRDDGREK